MASRLSNLFDERLKRPSDLVASPPQSLETLSSKPEEQEFVLRRVRSFEDVVPRVDYSDFSNFVFFNSALDYFNITGELILNSYPYGGSVEDLQVFLNELDDYQRFVVQSAWPVHSGHLRFNPAVSSSFVSVDDQGSVGGTAVGALMSPGTGSWTVDMWCVPPPALTGSNDVMFAVQKLSGTSGYSVFFSGSSVFFSMSSGSSADSVSALTVPGQNSYYSFVFDRVSSSAYVMTGSSGEFPVVVSSSSLTVSGPVDLGSSRLYIASGTLSGKITRPLTGSLDNVKLWSTGLTLSDVSSSFNSKTYAQSSLVGLWRFNETNATSSLYPVGGDDTVVVDHSGHRLNGHIQNYFNAIRASGSLVPFEAPDLVLFFNAPEVQAYIAQQQLSGTSFDRESDNIITELFPDKFFELEQELNTQVLENFLFIIARQFDIIKVRIDQFLNVLRTNYTQFNQAPDAVLADVGRFFGWDFTGNFLNADAFQYLLGRGVLGNVQSNKELDVKLFEIKNEFWRRTLTNLSYIYKSKGTRESVESLLRVYGVNSNFVHLKEYGYKPNTGISTFRIISEKSVDALTLGSGSTSQYVRSDPFVSSAKSVEVRVTFPTLGTPEMPATLLTGSVWTVLSGSAVPSMSYQLYFTKQSVSDLTGSLIVSSSAGQLILTGANVFDDRWYNVAFTRDPVSSSFRLDVRSIDDGAIDKHLSAVATVGSVDVASHTLVFWLGSTGSLGAEQWAQEARVWDRTLDQTELDDHALNFQSYGTVDIGATARLSMHWRLAEGVTSSLGGTLIGQVLDVSGHDVSGSGHGFPASANPYRKFLNEYNFIAPPDYGWNEERVRVLDSSIVKPSDAFSENRNVALEFNLVDALNEDISQMVATLDDFDNVIGLPANRYRSSYQDLTTLRTLYFKRLQGRVNFRVFADMLEFFDSSFVDMVRRLVPARANFLGDEFVFESHMLERPKLQWNYRRAPAKFEPLGVIRVWVRT